MAGFKKNIFWLSLCLTYVFFIFKISSKSIKISDLEGKMIDKKRIAIFKKHNFLKLKFFSLFFEQY